MLLAIDTSTRVMGVALYDGERVVCESVWASLDHHTVELAPAVNAAMARSGIGFEDLSALAVASGPGSFTGLRIGMALAKGLALAYHLPIIGVPTLDILAAAQPLAEMPLAATLQAGRGRLVIGWYQAHQYSWQSIGAIEILDVHSLSKRITQPTLVCGEFTEDERRILSRKRINVRLASPAGSLRRPSYLAELGWRRWTSGQVDDPATLAPVYLHSALPIPGA